MAVKWTFKRGKWRRINVTFDEQYRKTLLQTAAIRAIYDKDNTLSPQEQQTAIILLPGMTAEEMESIIMQTGPPLADSIRAIISKNRATNRSQKDQSVD